MSYLALSVLFFSVVCNREPGPGTGGWSEKIVSSRLSWSSPLPSPPIGQHFWRNPKSVIVIVTEPSPSLPVSDVYFGPRPHTRTLLFRYPPTPSQHWQASCSTELGVWRDDWIQIITALVDTLARQTWLLGIRDTTKTQRHTKTRGHIGTNHMHLWRHGGARVVVMLSIIDIGYNGPSTVLLCAWICDWLIFLQHF